MAGKETAKGQPHAYGQWACGAMTTWRARWQRRWHASRARWRIGRTSTTPTMRPRRTTKRQWRVEDGTKPAKTLFLLELRHGYEYDNNFSFFPENPQIVHRLHSGRLLNGPCLSSTHAGHRELAPRGMARRACFARILRLTDCATGRRARLPGDRTLDHLTHLTPVDLFFPPSPPSPPSGSYLPPTMAPTCLTHYRIDLLRERARDPPLRRAAGGNRVAVPCDICQPADGPAGKALCGLPPQSDYRGRWGGEGSGEPLHILRHG